MERGATDFVQFRRASQDDCGAALECLFAHLRPADRQRAAAQLGASTAGAPPEGLWVAYRKSRLVGAALVQLQPGRTATLWPPRISEHEPPAVARELTIRALARLPREKVRFAQVLLEVDHGPQAELLATVGFRHVSDLLYLVSLSDAFPASGQRQALEFVPYPDAEHDRFAHLVERTYVGSRDFPAIDGLREIEDVFAGYRATARFDPSWWLIARHEGADVGCLLVADDPANRQAELTYMGLVSEARGRGLGIALVHRAQYLAREAARERLVLAVDAENAPAIATYAAAGFVSWDRRSVFLRTYE